jgi:large subunit ribosomal protein L1
MNTTKRNKANSELFDRTKEYSIEEGIGILKNTSKTKFGESVDIAVKLGVDPKKSDQMIRGTVSLPHGIGKEVRVLVITKGGKEEEAQEAGADHVGFEEYLEKIKNGWTDVDVIIATPDSMGELGKLGKILGPRGLMPNPKSGTVTMDVGQAVKEVKAGKISFRVEKAGIVHAMVGKVAFDQDKLVENIKSFLATLNKLKPSSAKGVYIRGLSISSTMGPGIRLDKSEAASIY